MTTVDTAKWRRIAKLNSPNAVYEANRQIFFSPIFPAIRYYDDKMASKVTVTASHATIQPGQGLATRKQITRKKQKILDPGYSTVY